MSKKILQLEAELSKKNIQLQGFAAAVVADKKQNAGKVSEETYRWAERILHPENVY